MKLKQDVVSVILPVYNAGKFLSECLESLQNQSYPHLQIIAIDDYSRDNSYEILKKSKRKIKGLEVYHNKKRYGLAICNNRALKVAKGRFIAFMNPHDLSSVSRFKRQVSFLLKHPKVVAVGTQYTSIDEQNKKLEKSNLPQEHDLIYDTLLPTSSLQPETVMIDRTLIPKDLLHFKATKYPIVFNEVFVKFFQYGKVANIAQSLYLRREGIKRHGKRQSKANVIKSFMKLWVTSRTQHDYRPSFRSVFAPLMRGI